MHLSLVWLCIAMLFAQTFRAATDGQAGEQPVCMLEAGCNDETEVSLWLKDVFKAGQPGAGVVVALQKEFEKQQVVTMARLEAVYKDKVLQAELCSAVELGGGEGRMVKREMDALFTSTLFAAASNGKQYVAMSVERAEKAAQVQAAAAKALQEARDAAEEAVLVANSQRTAPAEVGLQLFEAAWHGDISALTALLHEWRGNGVVNWANPEDHLRTPLIRGTVYGAVSCVEALLSTPGIDVDRIDDIGMTALMHAAMNSRGEVASLLIAHGANFALQVSACTLFARNPNAIYAQAIAPCPT